MKKVIIILMLLVTTVTFSQNKNERGLLEVDGVCMMCKKRIEKAALNSKGVKFATWDIKTHKLSLIIDENKTDTKTIQNNIAAVGHDTKTLKATEAAYNSVHPCCRYRDSDVEKEHKKN